MPSRSSIDLTEKFRVWGRILKTQKVNFYKHAGFLGDTNLWLISFVVDNTVELWSKFFSDNMFADSFYLLIYFEIYFLEA